MEIFHKVLKHFFRSDEKTGKGTLSDLRRRNLVMLLNRLRLGNASSRAELARETGLDPKTITNLTHFLIEKDLLISSGFEDSSGGRPAERLMLNPKGAYSLGVDLGADHLRTVLVDLSGSIHISKEENVEDRNDCGKILKQIIESIHTVYDGSAINSWEEVMGIGFASTGFLDRKKGIALEAVHLPGWKNVAIREYLQNEFHVPVNLEESTRSTALGELWFGLGKKFHDFICLNLGYGIGVGIISNGKLHYGVSETAGEIGHTTVKPNGALCRCGKRGCLETIASGEAIARLSGFESAEKAAISAYAGDSNAKKIFSEAGKYIGIATANLVNILNPGMIVLSGGLCNAGTLLIDPFIKSLKERALGRSMAIMNIERTSLGDFVGAMGVSILPLKPLFESEIII